MPKMEQGSFFLIQEMCVHVGKCAFVHVNCCAVFKHLYQQNADLLHSWNHFGDNYEGTSIFYAHILYFANMCCTFQVWC